MRRWLVRLTCGSFRAGHVRGQPVLARHRRPLAIAGGQPLPAARGGHVPAGPAPARPLTVRQAKLAYLQIVGPGSALVGTLARGAPGATFSQFRAGALACARELHTQIGRFQAVRWPAQLQPRISALATTTLPSGIACLDAQAAASSMPAAMAVSNSNPGCLAAGHPIIPNPDLVPARAAVPAVIVR
jgi:hypothetical protein